MPVARNNLDRDPVKKMLAMSIQYHLITNPADRPGLMPQPSDVESVEATAPDATTVVIRVKTYTHGTRYFRVKLSEMML